MLVSEYHGVGFGSLPTFEIHVAIEKRVLVVVDGL